MKITFSIGLLVIYTSICAQHNFDNQSIIYHNNGNVGVGTTSPAGKLDIRGELILDRGGHPYLYSGTGTSELNRYFEFLNSPSYGSAAGIKAGGLLISDTYSYGSPAKNNVIVKGNVGVGIVEPYTTSRIHIKAIGTNPWGFVAEAPTSARIIGMSHDGSAGVIGVSYLNQEGWSPLEFHTQNINRMTIGINGNIGIGIENPDSKLVVDGKIRTEEIKVEVINAPDYVFEPDYKLPTLKETSKYISEHKHLPAIPSAAEMETNGIELGDMNMRLLKKIEELTLYQIELLEKVEKLQEKVEKLESNE